MVYERVDSGEWVVMDNSNVFINSDAKSLWMLVINGMPIFRTEFPYEVTDKELYVLNDEAEILQKELKGIKGQYEGEE